MSILSRVSRLCPKDKVRSSGIHEELGVEPILLRIERNQIRWLILSDMPNQEEPPGKTQDTRASELFGVPLEWLGRGRFGPCPHNPDDDKW